MARRPDEYFVEGRDDAGGTGTVVVRVIFNLLDSRFGPTQFGSKQPLTNGLKVEHRDADGNVLVDFLDGLPIKQGADFCRLAGTDVDFSEKRHMPVRWTIGKTNHELVLQEGEKLVIAVRDDLRYLASFQAVAQGYWG